MRTFGMSETRDSHFDYRWVGLLVILAALLLSPLVAMLAVSGLIGVSNHLTPLGLPEPAAYGIAVLLALIAIALLVQGIRRFRNRP
jgi:hypothetical protein